MNGFGAFYWKDGRIYKGILKFYFIKKENMLMIRSINLEFIVEMTVKNMKETGKKEFKKV